MWVCELYTVYYWIRSEQITDLQPKMVLRLLLLLLPFGLGQASDDVNPLLNVNAEAGARMPR